MDNVIPQWKNSICSIQRMTRSDVDNMWRSTGFRILGPLLFIVYTAEVINVVDRFGYARCLVENVEQGQRLCNCVNSQIL